MMPSSIILPDRAQPLANYPHAKKVGNYVFLSGISSREPSGAVRGVTANADGSVTKDIKEQTRGVIEK